VRDGDDAHVRDLLRALAQYADVDSLFALRDALTLDLEALAAGSAAGLSGAVTAALTATSPHTDSLRLPSTTL
jgi:hypothetical protein